MSTAIRPLAACTAIAVLHLLGACAQTRHEPSSSVQPPAWQTEFQVDKSDLASTGTNPYFILQPGHRITFAGNEGKKKVDLVITVLDETEMVDGVETRVVEERESVDGQLLEVSRNFFAISKRNNDVFYFGEDVDMYKNGKVTSHEGAWRSGVEGAKFGLMMPGVLQIGRRYYQEIAPDVAMDRAEIKSTVETVVTPAGRFERCVRVEETSPLEPDDKSNKLYAPGIGMIKDGALPMVSYGKAR